MAFAFAALSVVIDQQSVVLFCSGNACIAGIASEILAVSEDDVAVRVRVSVPGFEMPVGESLREFGGVVSFRRAALESDCCRARGPIVAPVRDFMIFEIVPRRQLGNGLRRNRRLVPDQGPEIFG